MAQLKKKFIGDNQVGAAKIRLENNANLKSRNAADSADISILKVNASDRIEFASVPQVTADAATANDVPRLSQVQALLAGEKPKQAVATVALADVDLASGADQSSQGGHTLVDGQRVLLANQTLPEENGIYVAVTAIDAQTWIRSTDFDAPSEIPGAYTVVQFGTDAGRIYVTTSSPSVIGVDPIIFVKEAAPSALNPASEQITLNGTDITNQYIDLAEAAVSALSISLFALEGPIQDKGVDYTISLTGGVAGVTRITFAGGLATGGASELISGDKLVINYSYV